MFTHTIETPRLLLRPFEVQDIQASFEIDSDPEVTKYTGDGGIKSYEEVEHLIKNVVFKDYEVYGYGRFAVILKETGKFIGFSGLKYLPEYDIVDLGYRFKREHWGKGFATETGRASVAFGFETLNLKQIFGFVLPKNTASSRVLKKLGFVYDTQFKEDGEMLDRYMLERH